MYESPQKRLYDPDRAEHIARQIHSAALILDFRAADASTS
jgi:hypothetical protein